MSRIVVQCVVVLFKQGKDCAALRSFAESCLRDPDVAQKLTLFVNDNSPSPQITSSEVSAIHGGAEYYHAPHNPGLAEAYNTALRKADARKIEWLLLVDQDTELTLSFLQELLAAIDDRVGDQVCAFVPKLIQDGSVLSPQLVGRLHNRPIPLEFSGISSETVTALNSASCFRVKALANIGDFPVEYWLDYLDHVTFHRLGAAGGQVYILRAELQHRLSLLNLESEMSISRYANVLNAEWMFVRETGVGGGTLMHRLRLLKRSLSRAVTVRNKTYSLLILRAALMRAPVGGSIRSSPIEKKITRIQR